MIDCVITSPRETTVYKKLKSVALPAFLGQMQILSGHTEAFILLREGDITLKKINEPDQIISIAGGECHVKNNTVTVIL